MENKVKGTYYLTMETVVGIVSIVVTVISIIVTMISIARTTASERHQKSNRPSQR